MKYTDTPFIFLLFISLSTFGIISYALDSNTIEQQANTAINELYHTLNTTQNHSMTSRINWISEQFLGMPYILGSLGEGAKARYDQFPQYRTDGFDCDTYVNTVLALATANSLETFKNCLKYTRYQDGNVSYIHRNHFTSIDWNANNQHRGLLKDITLNITNQKKEAVALYAEALINKPGWYQHKSISTIRGQNLSPEEQLKRLNELKLKGENLPRQLSRIPYLPLTRLFFENGEPNLYLFSQIPDGSIIEIIRPNWNLNQQIGTSLNVSHLGFAFWVKKQLIFRQASSQYGKVIDVPLVQYLKDARKSPTIKGINIQIVVPEKAVDGICGEFRS